MMVYPRVRQRAAGAVYRRGNPASAGWGQGRRGERAGPGGRSVGRLAALGRRGARDNTGRQGPDARAGPAQMRRRPAEGAGVGEGVIAE